jgi:hypothetical protein
MGEVFGKQEMLELKMDIEVSQKEVHNFFFVHTMPHVHELPQLSALFPWCRCFRGQEPGLQRPSRPLVKMSLRIALSIRSCLIVLQSFPSMFFPTAL